MNFMFYTLTKYDYINSERFEFNLIDIRYSCVKCVIFNLKIGYSIDLSEFKLTFLTFENNLHDMSFNNIGKIA